MPSPLVSVIVPTKNNARTLEACLRSICEQTYRVIELIVVDNHSTDATQEIAAKYADKVLTQGPERSAQRNRGAESAHGEFVVMIDSDMCPSPRVIEACVNAAAVREKFVGAVIPEESFGEGFWAQCKRLERSFYVGVPWMEGVRFFRRADFLAIGGYDESLVSGEDWDVSQRLATRGEIMHIAEFIRHDEGRLKLGHTLRKKWYYATRFAAYLAKTEHQGSIENQTSVFRRYALYFSQPVRLFRRPLVGLGMLFMKTCEFAVGGAALIVVKVRTRRH